MCYGKLGTGFLSGNETSRFRRPKSPHQNGHDARSTCFPSFDGHSNASRHVPGSGGRLARWLQEPRFLPSMLTRRGGPRVPSARSWTLALLSFFGASRHFPQSPAQLQVLVSTHIVPGNMAWMRFSRQILASQRSKVAKTGTWSLPCSQPRTGRRMRLPCAALAMSGLAQM